MVIVETEHEYHTALKQLQASDRVLVPIFTDIAQHPLNNPLSMVIAFTMRGDCFVFVFDHMDGVGMSRECLEDFLCFNDFGRTYVPLSKIWLSLLPKLQTLDLAGLEYFATGDVKLFEEFFPAVVGRFQRLYPADSKIPTIVPLMKWVEACERYLSHVRPFILPTLPAGFDFHQNVVLPACAFIEQAGLKVIPELVSDTHRKQIVNGMVYCNHNPYTSAGRIANSFRGWNYVALNKHNGERAAFVSRHERGVLFLVDFESFHPRLLADMMGFELPDKPIHQWLAEQYFNTSDVTPEQYEDGKKLTFRYLYSDEREGSDLPFFRKIYDFIDVLWDEFQQHKTIKSHTGRLIHLDRMFEPSRAKLFNYMLQLREMEVTMDAISRLIPLFQKKSSKVILYTYDSLLIDYDLTDGRELIQDTINILEHDRKFPVRVHMGANYHEMKNVTNILKLCSVQS